MRRDRPMWTAWACPMVGCAIGAWLMAAPAALAYQESSANASHRVIGPIVAALWLVSMWEVTRGIRWWTTPFAVWLLVEPIVLDAPMIAGVNSVATGATLLALVFATHPGDIRTNYGGGWSAIWLASDSRVPRRRQSRREVSIDTEK